MKRIKDIDKLVLTKGDIILAAILIKESIKNSFISSFDLSVFVKNQKCL